MPQPKTYAAAADQARRLLGQARLNDPDDHFPYKRADVQRLLDDNAPLGPGRPRGRDGSDDTSRTIVDYMSADIADASEAYIDAQAAHLEDPTDETRQAYEAARDRLVAARLDHRINRANTFTVGAAARRAD